MSITVIDLPVQDLRDARILHRRTHQIFDHYVRYLEMLDEWPAVTLAESGGQLAVSRGGEVLEAARILGRERLRAVVTDEDTAPIRQLVGSPSVRRLDWTAIDARERDAEWIDDWHVLFFAEPLGDEARATLAERVRAFFGRVHGAPAEPVQRLEFTDGGRCVRYRIRVPAHDESWYAGFLALLRTFSREQARILSFQGSEFADD